MTVNAFAEAAGQALAGVSGEPYEVATGQWIVPRDFLAALAAAAADWPETPEIWYGDIMQECFWTLVRRQPPEYANTMNGPGPKVSRWACCLP